MFESQTFSDIDQHFHITSSPVFTTLDDNDDDDDDDDDNDNDDDNGTNNGDVTQILERDANIFGVTTVFIEGRSRIVSSEYTTFGGLTTSANLFVARQYDTSVTISISSASSITSSIGVVGDDGTLRPTQPNPAAGKQAGGISQFDIEQSLQLNRGLVLLSLTREQIVQVLEYGLSGGDDSGVNALFPQVTGLSFSYDVNLPVGQRVRSLAVLDDDGKVIDVIVRNGQFLGKPQQTYRIVTTDYLANGGDGYLFPQVATNRINLTEVTVQNTTNIATFSQFGTEQDALAEYLATTYRTQPFSVQETTIDQDIRIQNLSFRSDTVIDIDVNQFVLIGAGRKDRIKGGNLADFLRGKGGDDRMAGRDGDDEIFCDNGNDKAKGGSGDDTVHGGKGNDKLVGNEGDDVLQGDKGNDTIMGSLGNDSLSGDDGNDLIRGGAGDDEIDGEAGSDRLSGGSGNDIISGDDGNDLINGGQGDDLLLGGDGDDILLAVSGNTLLDGGAGDNLLVGGRGNDTFVISSAFGTNTIREFNSDGTDRLFFQDYTNDDLFIEQSGNDTLIRVGRNILVVLLNVDADTLDNRLINDPDAEVDLCDRFGKPTALTFEYVGGTDLITGQPPQKATVNGDSDDDDLVYIVVSDRRKVSDVFEDKGNIYFEGSVELGEEFTADINIAGTKRFKSRTFISLFDDEAAFTDGEAPLQSMQYHTSCSEPMRLGDVIGGVELTGYQGDANTAIA